MSRCMLVLYCGVNFHIFLCSAFIFNILLLMTNDSHLYIVKYEMHLAFSRFLETKWLFSWRMCTLFSNFHGLLFIFSEFQLFKVSSIKPQQELTHSFWDILNHFFLLYCSMSSNSWFMLHGGTCNTKELITAFVQHGRSSLYSRNSVWH